MLLSEEARGPTLVIARARPRRVAFLVDPALPAEALDALMRANYGVWGGRLNPIIPVADGQIADCWWQLLLFYDPDVVHTYVDLPPELIERIEAELGPDHIRGRPNAEPLHYFPDTLGPQVHLRSVYPLMTPSAPSPHEPRPLTCTIQRNWAGARLLQRNFGLPHSSVGEEPPRGSAVAIDVPESWSFADVLLRLAEYPGHVFPCAAAGAHAQVAEPEDGYKRDYLIAVGDDVATWLHFWNRPLALNDYRRSHWNGLCLPLEYFASAGAVDALCAFLARYVWASGHPPVVDVVSCSVPAADLARIRDAIAGKVHGYLRPTHLSADNFPVLRRRESRFLPQEGLFRPTACPVAVQKASTPEPLLRAPVALLPGTTGVRVVDLAIRYAPRHAFYANEILWWRLPRRRELAHQFRAGARIDALGRLSMELDDAEAFTLSIPTDIRAINAAMGIFGRRTQRERLAWKEIRGTFQAAALSDKARYTLGVLELFGGLQEAGSFFHDMFWRTTAEGLAGVQANREEESLGRLVAKLQKYRVKLLTALEGGDVTWMAALALRLVQGRRPMPPDVTLARLVQSFRRQRPAMEPVDEAASEPLDESMRWHVQSFVDRGVLLQGVHVRCHACGSLDWRAAAELAQQVQCRWCREHLNLPVGAEWRLRLNGLVANAIALYGCAPVISTMHSLRQSARESFVGVPGMTFREAADAQAAEIDLVCMVDGALVVGEVKQTARELGTQDLQKLADVALKVRADEVVIGAFLDPDGTLPQRRSRLLDLLGTSCRVRAVAPGSDAFERRSLL